MTVELARATGLTGRVMGVDLDGTILDLARREAEQQQLSNITFDLQDVTTWVPGELFDVAFAGFLLSHLADPGRLVSAIRGHIKPGGVIIVEDIDFRT